MSFIKKLKNKYLNIDNFFNFVLFFFSDINNNLQKKAIKESLIKRNKTIKDGKRPNIFLAVKVNNWELPALVSSWKDIADIYHYDWGDKYDCYSEEWCYELKKDFNEALFSLVESKNKEKKIDIFFSYLSGIWIFPETIKRIGSLGIITINYSFDDSSLFWGQKELGQWSGNVKISTAFDFTLVAQDINDVKKYNLFGAMSFFLPSAGNPAVYCSSNLKKDILVSFVGQISKKRKKFIDFLKKNGVNVVVRGQGWPSGSASQDEMISIFQRSYIVLGFGYVGSRNMVRLKGRDFEIPMTGSAYLTTYNKKLSSYFDADKEILFYKNKHELLKKIQQYSNEKEMLIKIGLAGQKKSLMSHTWLDRWREVISICRD